MPRVCVDKGLGIYRVHKKIVDNTCQIWFARCVVKDEHVENGGKIPSARQNSQKCRQSPNSARETSCRSFQTATMNNERIAKPAGYPTPVCVPRGFIFS